MKITTVILSCISAFTLAACETTSTTYQKIGYGPELEYAKADCEIRAMSVEQGMFAMGSPGYVLGAQLGNAIGNEIRKQEFMKRCMVLNGWKAVRNGQVPKQASVQPARQPQVHPKPVRQSRQSGYRTGPSAPPSGQLVASQ